MHFMCFNAIGALRYPSASTVADVCVDRCGCLRRPVRMSAPTGADVCADRCATKKCEVRTQRVVVFDNKRR
uniref:hypothetical protein n=1 Tax=Leyella stercorea TaxID=363265 RepID=UPI003FF10185